MLIIKYSEFLIKKLKFMLTNGDIIGGSYAPLMQISPLAKCPLQQNFMIGLLELWKASTSIHALIWNPPKSIWNVRLGVALAIMHEEYGLISLLTHLIKILKLVREKPEVKLQFQNNEQFLISFLRDFAIEYNKSSKFLSTLKIIPELGEHRSKIYTLPLGLEHFLGKMPNPDNAKNIYDLLQTNQEIMGIYVPRCIESQVEIEKKINSEIIKNGKVSSPTSKEKKAPSPTSQKINKEAVILPKKQEIKKESPVVFSLDQLVLDEESNNQANPKHAEPIEENKNLPFDIPINPFNVSPMMMTQKQSSPSVDLLGIEDFFDSGEKKVEKGNNRSSSPTCRSK